MSEQADQPVEDEVLPGVEAYAPEADVEAEEIEPELDEDGQPIEAKAEDDSEEIEHDGVKHRVPKALKPLLMMQADYTRKTQEVAKEREALAARQTEIAQQAEAQATTMEERVTLRAVESSLKQYQEIDWNAYAEQYGERAAITAQGQWRQLEAAKSDLQTEITRKEAEHRSKGEQETATALRDAVQQLTTEIPGFTPDLDVKITKTATTLGFTPQELRDSLVGADGKPDTRAYRVLAKLTELLEAEATSKAKTTTAATTQKQAAVQPARTVGARATGFKPGLDDSLPISVWRDRRNAERAKAERR